MAESVGHPELKFCNNRLEVQRSCKHFGRLVRNYRIYVSLPALSAIVVATDSYTRNEVRNSFSWNKVTQFFEDRLQKSSYDASGIDGIDRNNKHVLSLSLI